MRACDILSVSFVSLFALYVVLYLTVALYFTNYIAVHVSTVILRVKLEILYKYRSSFFLITFQLKKKN